MITRIPGAVALALFGLLVAHVRGGQASQAVQRLDLRRGQAASHWKPAHDIAALVPTPEGLRIRIAGSDPYAVYEGPPLDFPVGAPLWLEARLRSEQSGIAQVFYYGPGQGPAEERSVRFEVPAGRWHEARVPLPPLGAGIRFRFDPPGTGGSCVVAHLAFEPRLALREPQWPPPSVPGPIRRREHAASGTLRVEPDGEPGGILVQVAGRWMAMGHNRPLIGWMDGGTVRWLDLARQGSTRVDALRTGFRIATTATDSGGARWMLRQHFQASRHPGVVEVFSSAAVSLDRRVVWLPLLMVLAGPGADRPGVLGTRKHQGLFCGVEYLEDEESSSERDIRGPGARRKVPDTLKITLPLMAIQAGGRHVGLLWEPDSRLAAVFDSPDRSFGSGGHAMGIVFPGSNGVNREEGSLLPYGGETLKAGQPVSVRASLLGGRSESVVEAVKQYVVVRGLPPLPGSGSWDPSSAAGSRAGSRGTGRQKMPSAAVRRASGASRGGIGAPDGARRRAPDARAAARAYLHNAAAGWTRSRVAEGDGRFRHAWPGGFQPQSAADAALFLDWLGVRLGDSSLRSAAARALERVPVRERALSGVSHIRWPAAPLVYGGEEEAAAALVEHGLALLARFEDDGTVLFRPQPGGLDYAGTHWERHANGLTAATLHALLEAAAFTGDPELRREGLRRLRQMDRYTNGVPRGAQTWEIPLHTPDILASAYLVRAYTLGWELTSDPRFLAQARHWAWTGVPFVYLVNPGGPRGAPSAAPGPVGVYATIPVLGATQWVAPNWMGLPVQWCGLVYADALYRLAPHDPGGPWRKLADGITASGVQQAWPLPGEPGGTSPERQGLLPDSYALRTGVRNDAAINPGTLQACAVRLFRLPLLFDSRPFLRGTVLVHAPGDIARARESGRSVSFSVRPWLPADHRVLVCGLRGAPRLEINGRSAGLGAPHLWAPASGRLWIRLAGPASVRLTVP